MRTRNLVILVHAVATEVDHLVTLKFVWRFKIHVLYRCLKRVLEFDDGGIWLKCPYFALQYSKTIYTMPNLNMYYSIQEIEILIFSSKVLGSLITLGNPLL